jgi:uncharacterized protein YlaI
MRNLPIEAWECGECTTYINVAFWKNVDSFITNFEGKTDYNPKSECKERLRIVLEETDLGDIPRA